MYTTTHIKFYLTGGKRNKKSVFSLERYSDDLWSPVLQNHTEHSRATASYCGNARMSTSWYYHTIMFALVAVFENKTEHSCF